MSNGLGHLPIADRIRLSSEVDANGCWVWRRGLGSAGYGAMKVNRKSKGAHRVSYETFVGPIPTGLVIDHLCRNRACVNPEHLEPVTNVENIRRGEPANRTHCPAGHEFTPENTRLDITAEGYRKRNCRTCARARDRARRARAAAARRIAA